MYTADKSDRDLRSTAKFLKRITAAYRFIVKTTAPYADSVVDPIPSVTDNLHLIKRSYSEAVSYLADIKKLPFSRGGVPLMYEYVYDFCRYGESTVEVSSVERLFSNIKNKADVSFSEASACISMIKCCCVEIISKSLTAKDTRLVSENVERPLSVLRLLRTENFSDITEMLCRCEDLLVSDSVYCSMDKRSKAEYRYRIEKAALKENKTEASVIKEALRKAAEHKVGPKSHFGYWLYDKKRYHYVEGCIALTVFTAILWGAVCGNLIVGIVSVLPIYYIVKAFLDLLYSYIAKPHYAPRMALKGGAPKTLICLVTFFDDTDSIDRTVAAMEKMSVTNKLDGFLFGFLADLKKSETATTEKDAVLTAYLEKRIKEAESRRGKVFFGAVRKRVFNPATERYEGRERKRGAICDFLSAVTTGNTEGFEFYYGDTEGAVYFTSLDADTMPEAGGVQKLVGVLEHPLSAPVLNADGITVSGGYGIAVPRMELTVSSWSKNMFTRLFGGAGGSDVYSDPSFSVYQDLYGEGIFAGKGVIRISLFMDLLAKELPDNRVLSHDAIESGYLRSAYVSDTVFFDSMPKNILSYLKRAHRWTRGDVQNTYFLTRYRNINGKKGNPLSFLTKFKLLDNVGRALLPVINCILILAGIFYPILAVIPVAGIFTSFFFSRIRKLFSPAALRQVRYGFNVLPTVTRAFFACVSELVLLPSFAYNAADAMIRSVTRIIRKDDSRLLEWTTAADADKQRSDILVFLRYCAPQLAGILLLVNPVLSRLGVLWLMGIPLTVFFSKDCKKSEKRPEKALVMRYLKDMWAFFEDHVVAENNYLPPDNYQEDPLAVAVKRTSPTNIGLTALSVKCGARLGFISADTMYDMLGKLLSSVEKLPKYRGNLYNWYDISTLSPLSPMFVSFVDSGNFAVAMDTLKAMLAEDHDIRAERILKRINKLLSDMDLGFMFDKETGLFHIGYDVLNGKLTDGHYDLYAGEATLSSYYCIAKGIVSPEHWKKLGRAVCERFGRLYVKSWTGTMFEYFLQTVFLPVPDHTFNMEMLKGCFYAQRRKNVALPWGNSESGYYLFDGELFYQYKAFGVQRLALKRGMDTENVISPYSAFLTLPYFPKRAIKNLKKLEDHSMYGQYGFFEALDATPSRVGKTPVPVRMYMSHHLSMSFLSAINYVDGNVVMSSFFSGDNSFYSELLEEKLPDSAVVMSEIRSPERKERISGRNRDVGFIDIEDPVWMAISDKKVTSVLNDLGCGYTEYYGTRVTRYRQDEGVCHSDSKGIFAAVRINDNVLCATLAPVFDKQASYKTSFGVASVSYKAKKKDVETVYTASVDPNSDCEIRSLTVKNESPHKRDAEVVFYLEPVLTDSAVEEDHPAFSNLFITGKFNSANNILTLEKRRRGNGDRALKLSLSMYDGNGEEQLYEYELSRFNILNGKKGMASFINAFDIDMPPSSEENLLPIDPCVCLRTQISLQPYGSEKIYLVMSISGNGGSSENKLMRLRTASLFNATADLRKLTLARLAAINADRESVRLSEILLASVISGRKTYGSFSSDEPSGYYDIYKYGLSGEAPLIFIRVTSAVILKAVSFVKAFLILKMKNIDSELLLGYSEDAGYYDRINETLINLIHSLGGKDLLNKKSGVYVRRLENINDVVLFSGVSCFYADIEKGWAPVSRQKREELPELKTGRPVRIRYLYKTGVGGYAACGKDIGFGIDDSDKFDSMPPWCHVLANQRFGTLVSHKSLGFTYADNSALKRLTPFSNDVFRDNDGEKLILKHGDSLYDVIKGSSCFFMKGKAVYETEIVGIRVRVSVFVCVSLPVKIVSVDFENTSDLDIDVEYACNVVLGDKKRYPLFKKEGNNFIEYTDPYGKTAGTAILYGKNAAVEKGKLVLRCNSGERIKESFCLCYAPSERRKKGLMELFEKERFVSREMQSTEKYWSRCGKVSIKTPDTTLDMFVNGFLQYQVKASRLFAKTGFYQCSGATGFRDQLQDAMSLSLTEPKLLKKQIMAACSRQFFEGDVLHWWHDDVGGKIYGSRSRSSDDLMWLPLAVNKYMQRTADTAFLDMEIHYVQGRELAEGEKEAYMEVKVSQSSDTVYEHSKKAIKHGIKTGKHGLILFGRGDWNDGMNNVGANGKGETVWGSFFTVLVLEEFAETAKRYGDTDFRDYCENTARALRENIEMHGWDENWYKRGYFDNGAPLGASSCKECKIDIIPQAFAALCGGFDPSRVRRAIDSAEHLLVDREEKTVKLLSPPFSVSSDDPGYIMSYVPGVRENGGQYTHAAVWYAAALIKECRYEDAYGILEMLNPVNRTKTPSDVYKYRVEPYVMAGDIYSSHGHSGMGGWTHYTGSAGWYFRTVIEEFLGIKIKGDRLLISPSLPKEWKEYRVELNIGKSRLDILVRKSSQKKITVDRNEVNKIILDGKSHEIVYQYLPI